MPRARSLSHGNIMRGDNILIGFHLDLKSAHYRADYLAELFPRLAAAGYTYLFFEIEDKVRLESTRGTEWCEAYSKVEFARILSLARQAGLTPIPLIQTLGHMESILSHSAYHALRESPASAYMLCPSNPRSAPFLIRYIDEVGELFDNPPFIHLGADEAWLLGTCPECRARVSATSKSDIYFQHMDRLFKHALSRGWRPIAWVDMVLAHSESIDRFDREIVWMDWDYWTQESGSAEHMHWASGKSGGPEIFPDAFFQSDMGRFARNADGCIRPWFYTDFLIDKGFDVILAPATRCGGDHVFAPQLKHLGNVMGAALRAGREPRPLGVLVTSWALRLNHIETQWPALLIPQTAQERPAADWRALRADLTEKAIGTAVPAFFDAWQNLCPCFALAESWRAIESDIHYYGQHDSIPHLLGGLQKSGGVAKERALLEELLPRYAEGAHILDAIAAQAPGENSCLRFWRFAAKAIRARAEEELLFLDALERPPDQGKAAEMLLRLESLQDEYRGLLLETYTPASVERELSMIFATPWRHLMRLSRGKT